MIAEKFRGEYGSPEHKEHLARVAHENDVYDVIDSLCTLYDPAASIEDRGAHARDLADLKEYHPTAYAEGLAIFEKEAGGLMALAKRQRPAFNPEYSRIGDVFSEAPPSPPFVVNRLLPRSHGVENAIGGAGKTTRHIWEAAHIILGRDLYGQRVMQSGAVLFVTKEDDEELFRHRIYQVIESIPDLTATDKKRLAEHLHVLILTGTNERLVIADRSGNLMPTDLPERIVRGYSKEGLALVEFDPFNLFAPGERYVNDGEASALSAMAQVSQSLRCAVRATAHISKFVHREGISDAHSGRGGSAGGDNSRFVWNYLKHDAVRDKGINVPPALAHHADIGDLYRLDVPKVTASRPAFDSVWIVRQGFSFAWHANLTVSPTERRKTAAEGDMRVVVDYLRSHAHEGYYSLTELKGDAQIVGIGERRISAAVTLAKARGLLVDSDLPENMRKGGRKTYLAPVEQPAPGLDTSKPIAELMASG